MQLEAATSQVEEIRHRFMTQNVAILDCFPIRLKAAHLLVRLPKTGRKKMAESIVSFTKQLFENHFGARTISTSVTSTEEMAFELYKLGFGEQSLPVAFGGIWVLRGIRTADETTVPG